MEHRAPEREFVRIGELIQSVTKVQSTVHTTLSHTQNLPQPTNHVIEGLLNHALQTLEEALSILTKPVPTQTFAPILDKTLLKRPLETPTLLSKPTKGTAYLGMFNGQEVMTDHFGITVSPQSAAAYGITPGDSVRATVTPSGAVYLIKL